jgi:sugar O-acyltransferase (sialic acid O-acetyltransferase NeuD family)
MVKKLAIVGSGDLGQLIAHHAKNSCGYQIVGFFDDYLEKNTVVGNGKILGKIDEIIDIFENKLFDTLAIGIGYKYFSLRIELFNKYKSVIPFDNIIHPSVYIDKSVVLGSGIIIFPGCVLDIGVVVNDNVLLNTGCIIAHDSNVGAHSFISPGVCIAGFVKIGCSCFIGINTTIIDNLTIVDNTQTGGGTVVIKNINKPGLYVGNPARLVR